ncbi:MAG: NADH-quinone oxidoreductase subunit C [Candidatus Marinimicrobia bacterium]|nr:NADH-quinone oxidoreductase subunit C [Candidatus Neomarinimicrobiota bacterium]
MDHKKLFEELKKRFGEDKILAFDDENSIPPKISVAPNSLNAVCDYLAKEYEIKFDALMCLSGVDVGDELGVALHLHSMKDDVKVGLESLCKRDNPHIDSVASVYATANWHEREAYDMFGIIFDGHPKLTRIFLADDWEGWPLRKDYVPAQYWHGMPIAKELTHKMK